ncbi:hypothetical protein BDZ89DRAFT_504922 [Hymenopellis radicata]|nr:hypothetical protein BDZ89DRAFT_504922 [Hymenopellis radicata]
MFFGWEYRTAPSYSRPLGTPAHSLIPCSSSTSMSSTAVGCASPEISPGSSATPPPEPVSGTRIPTPGNSEKHFFGIKQDVPHNGYVFREDYDKRFPEDRFGEETAPNARVWRAYMEEAAAFDANMVGQSRDGLDVMLVFAGLFSAVVTSFLVQVSQNLQADYGQMTAILIHDLVFIQLAMADGASVPNITLPSVNPAAPFVADGMDIWVNGFWVVSLTASLAVALAAVLVKQWLHHYMSLHLEHLVTAARSVNSDSRASSFGVFALL